MSDHAKNIIKDGINEVDYLIRESDNDYDKILFVLGKNRRQFLGNPNDRTDNGDERSIEKKLIKQLEHIIKKIQLDKNLDERVKQYYLSWSDCVLNYNGLIIRKKVEQFIGKDKIESALIVLKKNNNKDIKKEIIMLEQRYRRNERSNTLGKIERDKYIAESSKISSAILYLIEELEESLIQ